MEFLSLHENIHPEEFNHGTVSEAFPLTLLS
jgi:hypothetical protein